MYYNLFSAVICICLLCYSSYTDIKRKEIPVELYSVASVAVLAIHIYLAATAAFPVRHNIWNYLIAMVIMAVLFFIQAIFSGGGGDIVMMAFVGLCNGILFSLITTVIAFAATIPFFIYKKIQHKNIREEYPFAPFACIGYICTLFIFCFSQFSM